MNGEKMFGKQKKTKLVERERESRKIGKYSAKM